MFSVFGSVVLPQVEKVDALALALIRRFALQVEGVSYPTEKSESSPLSQRIDLVSPSNPLLPSLALEGFLFLRKRSLNKFYDALQSLQQGIRQTQVLIEDHDVKKKRMRVLADFLEDLGRHEDDFERAAYFALTFYDFYHPGISLLYANTAALSFMDEVSPIARSNWRTLISRLDLKAIIDPWSFKTVSNAFGETKEDLAHYLGDRLLTLRLLLSEASWRRAAPLRIQLLLKKTILDDVSLRLLEIELDEFKIRVAREQKPSLAGMRRLADVSGFFKQQSQKEKI